MNTPTPAAPTPARDDRAQAQVEAMWRKALLDLSAQFLALARVLR